MERPVSIDSLKIVPPDRRSLAALGMTWWGVTQNGIIRLKLMEWKIGYLQNQIDSVLSSQEPLIFRVWFWIFSIIAWAGSIVGGKILTFFSQRYIIEKYWDKQS